MYVLAHILIKIKLSLPAVRCLLACCPSHSLPPPFVLNVTLFCGKINYDLILI